MSPTIRRLFTVILLAFFFIVFLIDYVLPPGVEVSVLYTLPMVTAVFLLREKRHLFALSGVVAAMQALNFLYLDEASHPWVYVVNRMVALLVIFLTTYLAYQWLRLINVSLETEEKFKIAVRNAPYGIMMCDSKGLITAVNPQCASQFGYSPDEMTGMQVEKLVPEEQRQQHEEYRRQYLQEPLPRAMGAGRDLRARRKDGSHFPVEIGLSAVKLQTGIMVVCTVVDISDRQNKENQIRLRNRELEQFAYVASHDLQAPLRHVSSFVELFVEKHKGHVDEESQDWLHRIVGATQRMRRMIDALLRYSRLGSKALNKEVVDTNRLVAEVIDLLSHQIKDVQASVEVKDLPRIVGDRDLLSQLFQNLLENALKYCSPDQKPKIEVASVRENNRLRIFVSDNGLGIPEQHREKIFNMFQRLHGKDDYDGMGIGLAICKKIVDIHNGDLGMNGNPQGGSIFHFTIETV